MEARLADYRTASWSGKFKVGAPEPERAHCEPLQGLKKSSRSRFLLCIARFETQPALGCVFSREVRKPANPPIVAVGNFCGSSGFFKE